MRIKRLPPIKYLSECFSLDVVTGRLQWRRRPSTHFATDAIAAAWNSRWAGSVVASKNSRGYLWVKIEGERYLAHRIVWALVNGFDAEQELDHRDGNPLNNAPDNLREATREQNCANRASIARELPKNVYAKDGKFRVIVTAGKKRVDGGHFATVDAANEVAKAVSLRLHGSFSPEMSRGAA